LKNVKIIGVKLNPRCFKEQLRKHGWLSTSLKHYYKMEKVNDTIYACRLEISSSSNKRPVKIVYLRWHKSSKLTSWVHGVANPSQSIHPRFFNKIRDELSKIVEKCRLGYGD
jgi:hypothetical protein